MTAKEELIMFGGTPNKAANAINALLANGSRIVKATNLYVVVEYASATPATPRLDRLEMQVEPDGFQTVGKVCGGKLKRVL